MEAKKSSEPVRTPLRLVREQRTTGRDEIVAAMSHETKVSNIRIEFSVRIRELMPDMPPMTRVALSRQFAQLYFELQEKGY